VSTRRLLVRLTGVVFLAAGLLILVPILFLVQLLLGLPLLLATPSSPPSLSIVMSSGAMSMVPVATVVMSL
jgi:hypothetical protein